MNYEICYPYYKTLCIYIRGNTDEGQPGYVVPEEDIYLKDIQDRLHKEFIRNVWEGEKIGCWDVLKSEIQGPDSSGYENTLTIIIGFPSNVHENWDKPSPRWERFERVIKEFTI